MLNSQNDTSQNQPKPETETGTLAELAEKQSDKPAQEKGAKPIKEPDPVRRITRIVLGVCVILFVWHLVSDRFTPSTDQARVRGFVVPIAPKVSGTIKEIKVAINQIVKKDDVLFKIDPKDYEIAVQAAQAALDTTGQTVGVETAAIQAAAANVGDNNAQLIKARQDYARLKRIASVDPGAVSKALLDSAQAAMAQAKSRLDGAKADLEKARQQLGKSGKDNPKIRAAVAALEKARMDLARTTIYAPSDGYTINLQVDIGHYAKAGQPLVTFVSETAIWVQADMRENAIGNIKEGNSVDIMLDIAPGRIFKGRVLSIGYGVDKGQGGNLGSLPTIKGTGGWLRDAQRFPVIINFADEESQGLRFLGGQADVMVYTGNNFILNTLGWVWIRLLSILSYVY